MAIGRLSEAMPLELCEAQAGQILIAGAERRWQELVRRVEDLRRALTRQSAARFVILPSSLGPLSVGTFMAESGGSFVKADNTVPGGRARLVVEGATSQGYRATAARIQLRWENHGVGAAGTEFYTGTAGGVVAAEPDGPTVYVSQKLGVVLDPNNVLLEWDTPILGA